MTCRSCAHPPATGDIFCPDCRNDMTHWLDIQYRLFTGFSSRLGRMKTADEFRADFDRRLPDYAKGTMRPSEYQAGVVSLVFDVVSETLAEITRASHARGQEG